MKLPEPRWTVTDSNHRYSALLKTKEVVGPLTSVTTILNVIEKPALKGWAAKMAAQYFYAEILRLGNKALVPAELARIAKDAQSAHTKFAKDAADLGTACHAAFEAIVFGNPLEAYPKELEQPIAAFKAWRLGPGSDIELVASEVALASLEHRFGGRLDVLGFSERRGGWGIVDYKTSSGFYGNEYAYQTAGGYAIAVEEQYGVKINWADIIRFGKKPPFDSEGRSVIDMANAKVGFLHALGLVRANALKMIGEPNFTSTPAPEPTAPKAKKAKPSAAEAAAGF